MTSLIQFAPIYQERVWGGHGLATFLGRQLPGATPIGESWEIVDRPEAQSVVTTGEWAGKPLHELMTTRRAELMGPAWPAGRPFPILVKWLDCRERLSLQVHPPASIAAKLGGEPKTENWYIAHAEPGAAVLAGLKDGVDAARFRAALKDNTAESLVYRLPTVAGDSLLIQSGVMHAIDGGNIISLEIQQNLGHHLPAFTTGDGMGLDGKPRAMHVEQSMAALEANTAGTPAAWSGPRKNKPCLADCREFRNLCATSWPRVRSWKFPVQDQKRPRLLAVTAGRVAAAGRELALGDNALLPFAGSFDFTARTDATVLVTDHFSSLEK